MTDIICSKCSAPNPPDTVFCGKCGARIAREAPSGEPEDPLIGTFVGDRFLVHQKLGEGGMGVVYRAEQTAIKRTVALKVLHAHLTQDESLHARFHNEAAASSRLTHPNTVTIYDFGRTNAGSLYIAMEYIEGKSLDEEIRKNGALDWRRACHIAMQICGSLNDAHTHGIVHRDLKPENIMLCERGGESDFVKVLDFGIAKIIGEEGQDQRQALTKTGMVFGTPQYMSPEQIRGEKVDYRTDIYSIGVILYEMFSGVLPFTSEMPMGVLSKHLLDTPPALKQANPNIDVPDAIESIVMAALAKSADKRPQTTKELAKMLATVVGTTANVVLSEDIKPARTVPTPPPNAVSEEKPQAAVVSTVMQIARSDGAIPKPAKNKSMIAIAAAGAFVVIAGAGAAWYFSTRPSNTAIANPWPGASQAGIPNIPQQLNQAGVTSPMSPVNTQTQPSIPQTPSTTPTTSPTNAIPAVPGSADSHTSPAENPSHGHSGGIKSEGEEISCVFSGASDAIAQAIRARLKTKENSIRRCARESTTGGISSFSFDVPGNTSRPVTIQPATSNPMNNCLEKVLDGDFGAKDDDNRKGTAVFTFEKKGGALEKCIVVVDAAVKAAVPLLPNIKWRLPDKTKFDPSQKSDKKKEESKKSSKGSLLRIETKKQ